MSSTERAPEPTMEDILASIRRIITDDDTGKAPADKAAAQSEDEGLEGEADNQIIDDIARVLTSGGDAPANEDEEIMDLTGELGGLELIEEEPEELPEAVEVVDTTPEFVDSIEDSEELLALDDAQADVLEPDLLEPDVPEAAVEIVETVEVFETVEIAELAEPEEMELPVEETAAPEMPPMAPPPLPEPVAEAVPEAPKLSASEEAATALERAIAALKAGQSPTPAPAPMPSFTAPAPAEPEAEEPTTGVIPLPTDIPMAVPMETPEPDTETHLDPDVDSVLEMAEDAAEEELPAEDEFVLMDAESEVTMVLEEAEPEQETESAPFWPPQDAEPVEPAPAPVFAPTVAEIAQETVAVATNGAVPHGTPGGKSLEDSIKEMLRPMLREWLNENMPRMIREELDSDALQRGQD
ncbi:DUF2497 domain-containing protein [Methyloceanibacter sp. wino2]|uniref:DUF2497 domain-containing protein n=1 Tax=Methyloceanibacter sp. wino2 TaxID=2170729 RepID=UPI000D3E82A8|nr:DUF2497 domain-containing protein [Methyloceanibacter sp. wino2]